MTFDEWIKTQRLYPIYNRQHVEGLMKSAWQAATEEAGRICDCELEAYDPPSIARYALYKVSKKIRQQESADGLP